MAATPRQGNTIALVDHVYNALYTAIAHLVLPPGNRINVDQVARDLAVSPTPVREALARLEAEHIVQKRHRVGYVTAPLLTQDEFARLFEFRRHVEPWLAAEAARRVRDNGRRMDAGTDDSAPGLADARVHDAIAALSGHTAARRALWAVHSHLHIQRCYANTNPLPNPLPYPTGHDDVVTAIEAGDPDLAETAMSNHLDAASHRVAASFGG